MNQHAFPLRSRFGLARLGHAAANLREAAKAHLRALAKAREVRPIRLSPGLSKARHVVVLVVRNEAPRMPFFLAHYRAQGFDHFMIIDNQSTDTLLQDLAHEADVSLFSAQGNFGRARYGNDWVNGLLGRYCHGKWVMYVDADEIFVFPHCDTLGVASLTDHLRANGRSTLPCVMVDMYSERAVQDNICRPGQNPLEVCNLYDGEGYEEHLSPQTGIRWIKGGVRGRLFFEDRWKGPALNKTPLVFWRRSYAFLKSSHEVWPPRLNERPGQPASLRGALLHFKFLSTLTALLSEEQARRQHTTEYEAYARLHEADRNASIDFVAPVTRQYQGWGSLAADGLIKGAAWPDKAPPAPAPQRREALA